MKIIPFGFFFYICCDIRSLPLAPWDAFLVKIPPFPMHEPPSLLAPPLSCLEAVYVTPVFSVTSPPPVRRVRHLFKILNIAAFTLNKEYK